jgi:hypothetical protein
MKVSITTNVTFTFDLTGPPNTPLACDTSIIVK